MVVQIRITNFHRHVDRFLERLLGFGSHIYWSMGLDYFFHCLVAVVVVGYRRVVAVKMIHLRAVLEKCPSKAVLSIVGVGPLVTTGLVSRRMDQITKDDIEPLRLSGSSVALSVHRPDG
jgi:hypothetical protein